MCLFIPWWRVPKGYMAQGYFLFLQGQIKDIIIESVLFIGTRFSNLYTAYASRSRVIVYEKSGVEFAHMAN
jgi:hypothetical protein